LIEKKIQPPFVPDVTSKEDTSNIDSTFTDEVIELSDGDGPTTGTIFEDFTYTGGDQVILSD